MMSGAAGGERRNETCAIAVVINSRILLSDHNENDSHILKIIHENIKSPDGYIEIKFKSYFLTPGTGTAAINSLVYGSWG